jgi:hypothetical protein
MPILVLTAVGCSLFSFALGYFGFKIRTRWCRDCGLTLCCRECVGIDRRRPQAAGR